METNKCSILDILAENLSIKIPCWHREFVWDTPKTAQLYDDIEALINSKEIYSHFFGIIISANAGAYSRIKLVDGFQRIMAVNIFVFALCDHYHEQKLKKVLLYRSEITTRNIKLDIENSDNEIYKNLLTTEDYAYKSNSAYTQAYRDFTDRIENRNYKLDEYVEALKKLQIINIKLGAEDNPQLIFDSINAFSTPLTRFEKIKNYIFMGIPEEDQHEILTKYWNQLEETFNNDGENFITFLVSYVSMQQTSEMVNESNILTEFNRFYNYKKNYKSANEIISEIFKFAQYYIRIINADFTKEIAVVIEKITEISKTPELFAFMFELVDDFQNGLIPKVVFIEILENIYTHLQIAQAKNEKLDFSGLGLIISKILAQNMNRE